MPMEQMSYNQRRLADLFKAIGHPTRLRILKEVLRKPYCVSELQRRLDQTQPNVSQHLAVLRDRGLVVPERRGNLTCYRLADERVRELLEIADAILRRESEEPASAAPERAPDRREPGRRPRGSRSREGLAHRP
jgi:DNA-binding transcriptional ArsR family regulator